MGVSTVCPKCERERRPEEAACARCGLLVARWPRFQPPPIAHELVDASWAALEALWEDDSAHARFLDEASRAEALDVAATRYRERARKQPGDERARAGLTRAALLAERLHDARAAAPSEPPGWVRGVGVAGALVVLGAALWLLSVALRH